MRRPDKVRGLIFISILAVVGLVHSGCAGGSQQTTHVSDPQKSQGTGDSTPCTQAAPTPSSTPVGFPVKHVFIVMEENHSYKSIIGSEDMTYLNQLATTYALAQGYHADTHPSIGNYFMLTTGQIITNDDSFTSTVTDDNIVRHLIQAGKTWKEYSESLPSVGYTGGDKEGYTEHHNPLSYFSDVRQDGAQDQNLVPFTQLAIDLANGTLPDYSFIVPDDDHNSEQGSLQAADLWLHDHIDPLIKSADFNTPGFGVLIITYDESFKTVTFMGGGRVPWVVVGPDVKPGYTSSTCYQHESTLRFMSEAIGLTSFPGAADTAADMREFINGN